MIYVLSILGYGDCLITLSLLEQSQIPAHDCVVVGSRVTTEVAHLLDRFDLSIVSLLPNRCSLFTLKTAIKKGEIRSLLADWRAIRQWGRGVLIPRDTVIVEKSDWRNRLLFSGAYELRQIARMDGAYLDRATELSHHFCTISLRSCATLEKKPQHLLVNPCAGSRGRSLSYSLINVMFRAAENEKVAVSLIDPDGSYKAFKDRAFRYIWAPTLTDSDRLLRDTDLYIGPDSFFMHLAYYRGIPFFAFFQRGNVYFAPPGMIEANNYMFFDEARDQRKLDSRLRNLLSGL